VKKIKVLQNNVFGQLYMYNVYLYAVHNRDGDLAESFAHKIQSFPLSL